MCTQQNETQNLYWVNQRNEMRDGVKCVCEYVVGSIQELRVYFRWCIECLRSKDVQHGTKIFLIPFLDQ